MQLKSVFHSEASDTITDTSPDLVQAKCFKITPGTDSGTFRVDALLLDMCDHWQHDKTLLTDASGAAVYRLVAPHAPDLGRLRDLKAFLGLPASYTPLQLVPTGEAPLALSA
jgi:hypothetical protein